MIAVRAPNLVRANGVVRNIDAAWFCRILTVPRFNLTVNQRSRIKQPLDRDFQDFGNFVFRRVEFRHTLVPPHKGRHRKIGRRYVNRVQLSQHFHVIRFNADFLAESLSAVSSNDSSLSWRPPGNAIWPGCFDMSRRRRVKTSLISSCSPGLKSINSTAANFPRPGSSAGRDLGRCRLGTSKFGCHWS